MERNDLERLLFESRKKILKIAKGFRGAHSKLFRVANQQVMKALSYGYVGRKQKKRTFRKLWISRINIATRSNGLIYSKFIFLSHDCVD